MLFYEHFINSSSSDAYLKLIENDLIKITTTEINPNEMQNILKQILDMFKQHTLVFYSTVKRLEKVEQTTNVLVKQMEDINSKQNITDGLLIANEIASLYIEYYVKPVFHRRLGHSSWDTFCDKLAAIEAEIDDRALDASEKGLTIPYETLYKDLINYLQPLQKDIGLSLTNIRFLKRDRNDLNPPTH